MPNQSASKSQNLCDEILAVVATFALVGAASAADLPRKEPRVATVGKTPIGKLPGKYPVGKYPVGKYPVVAARA
jgi:hypothetical protein